ncbi:MAG: hypothetical protein Q8K58_11185 [Acidimicrobiales bacterium]|nr:hypothetical protein [Acidimicrobiales bacterium]
MLAGDDKAERIAIAEIIEALHEQLPRCPSRWNEKTRNQTELYAWLNGRHRICDLAGVASG